MGITYTDEKKFTKEQTQQLFRSVGWVSGKYPERLYKALMGSSTVFSAWDGDRLVGLVRVLDDTEMVAYMHYVLVMASQATWWAWSKRDIATTFILKSCRKKARTPPSTRSTASQSWKTARPCRSAIRENAAETSIVTPTILLPPSNDGGIRVSANTSEGWLACFTRKDRSMTGSDERNTQNATSVGKAAFPAPSAMKSPHPNRRQRHVVLRRRNYSPHHSHPHPAVRDLNVIMVFWGMRHSHFLNNSEYVPSL